MEIQKNFLPDFPHKNGENSRLYSFLATNYDISNLASKINATNARQLNVLNLKKAGQTAV